MSENNVIPFRKIEIKPAEAPPPVGLNRDQMPHWQCPCGNPFFCITETEIYCPNCGATIGGRK